MSFVQVKGPDLKKVFKQLERNFSKSLFKAMDESAKYARDRARDKAPVLTGKFRRSIRISRNIRMPYGLAKKVGVAYVAKAHKYSHKVEKKHKLFTYMPYRELNPVRNVFFRAITKGISRRIM